MLQLHCINDLKDLMQPGISLARNEVIKRYRALANYKASVVQLLCMTDFCIIGRNEKGELYYV